MINNEQLALIKRGAMAALDFVVASLTITSNQLQSDSKDAAEAVLGVNGGLQEKKEEITSFIADTLSKIPQDVDTQDIFQNIEIPFESKDLLLVPRIPTEKMWNGLARALIMWMDMSPKTPRALFQHLKNVGEPIPQWLRDEHEMKSLDHVPSKGTRAVLVYRAMIEGCNTG